MQDRTKFLVKKVVRYLKNREFDINTMEMAYMKAVSEYEKIKSKEIVCYIDAYYVGKNV